MRLFDILAVLVTLSAVFSWILVQGLALGPVIRAKARRADRDLSRTEFDDQAHGGS